MTTFFLLRWCADDGPTLNAGLVVVRISRDPVQYCEEILYFCDFSGGLGPPVPSLDSHMGPDNVYPH